LHEREQLRANDLFIDVNNPLNIDSTLVGRWISISWFRKLDPNSMKGFSMKWPKAMMFLLNLAIGPNVLRCHHQGNISGNYYAKRPVYYFCVLYEETL
jgi:hypothetical protein